MGQIRQVLARFQHGRVHQRRQFRVVVDLQLGLGRLDGFGLFSLSPGQPSPISPDSSTELLPVLATAGTETRTSPFSNSNTS